MSRINESDRMTRHCAKLVVWCMGNIQMKEAEQWCITAMFGAALAYYVGGNEIMGKVTYTSAHRALVEHVIRPRKYYTRPRGWTAV